MVDISGQCVGQQLYRSSIVHTTKGTQFLLNISSNANVMTYFRTCVITVKLVDESDKKTKYFATVKNSQIGDESHTPECAQYLQIGIAGKRYCGTISEQSIVNTMEDNQLTIILHKIQGARLFHIHVTIVGKSLYFFKHIHKQNSLSYSGNETIKPHHINHDLL